MVIITSAIGMIFAFLIGYWLGYDAGKDGD